MMMRYMRLVGAVVVMMLAVACGGPGESDAEPTVVLSPTPTVSLEIGELTWASSVNADTGVPTDELVALPNDADQIVAALSVPSMPAGTTLQASWTIDGAPLPALRPDSLVAERPLEDAWVSWQLSWTAGEPWPIGTLGITIEIDGAATVNEQIQIVWAGS